MSILDTDFEDLLGRTAAEHEKRDVGISNAEK